MGMNEQRMEILRRVGAGELTVEEGNLLLDALERGQNLPTFEPPSALNMEAAAAQASASEVPQEVPGAEDGQSETVEQGDVMPSNLLTERQIRNRKRIWIIPFLLGLLLTSLGGVWMVQGYQKAGLGWGFWLSWIPFCLGVAIMAFSWNVRRGCWLHVRINQRPGNRPQKIDLSFPLPLHATGWFFRTFGDRIPAVQDKHLDDIFSALETGITSETPMVVQVDEGDEQVEVWIERL